MDFSRYGLNWRDGRSRSTFHMRHYNMLQWSWFLEHSSPLKCQINPWTIHHSVFGVAVKSFNTLWVSFPSSNFAGEEIQLRALHKVEPQNSCFVFITKKMLYYIKEWPIKILYPVFSAPCHCWQTFPCACAEPSSFASADSTEKGQRRGGGFSHSSAF